MTFSRERVSSAESSRHRWKMIGETGEGGKSNFSNFSPTLIGTPRGFDRGGGGGGGKANFVGFPYANGGYFLLFSFFAFSMASFPSLYACLQSSSDWQIVFFPRNL